MLGSRAISEGPLSAIPQPGPESFTQELIIRFATQSFVTRPTDSPAHEFIEGRITRGLSLGRQLKIADGGQFGALMESSGGPNFGELELLNLDGALDSYVNNFYADGRQVRLKVGATEIDANGRERVKSYSSFATVYTAIAGEWSFEHDVVRLRIRNLSDRLKDRLQIQVYAGTGGKQGTADIAGRTLPTCFGTSLNVSAQLVDPTILTYQLHGGTMDSIIAVYDAGIAVPADVDYANYTALAAAPVPAGSFASCLAEGFIRLGVAPVGAVTADIRGDNQMFDQRGFSADHGGVIKKILLNYSDLVEDDLDLISFDVLDAVQPAAMGIFFPAGDQSTVEEAIERIAFSCGAFAGQDRSGLFRVQRLEAPKAIQDWTFDDRDIIAIERESLPYTVPWKAWGVGRQINNTVQTGSDLAAGVSQSRRQFLESEYRWEYVQSSTIALAHRTSAGAPLRRSLFLDRNDAAAEAQRLIEFYSLERAMYRVQVKNALFSVEIGQTVRLIYNRWNLHGGQNFIVIGVNDDADAVETELLLFGSGSVNEAVYDVYEAFAARRDSDLEYFQTQLPVASMSTGVVSGAPVPPSQRGWNEIEYPVIPSSLIGQQAKNVLVPPAFPLDFSSTLNASIPWSDPNPSTNTVAAYVGAAPDGSPNSIAIEIRYLGGSPSQQPQYVDAYVQLIENPGVRHFGAKLEVWTEAGFDWGASGTGGKVAGGIWAGRRPASGGATQVSQGGTSFRNIWGVGVGSPTIVNARGYAYILNRGTDTEGIKTANIPDKWLTGQWQELEYEGYINTPGFADGYGRMWIDGECVSEMINVIWSVGNDWLWRGIFISDAWQDGDVPKSQKRWIRNLTVYVPPEE